MNVVQLNFKKSNRRCSGTDRGCVVLDQPQRVPTFAKHGPRPRPPRPRPRSGVSSTNRSAYPLRLFSSALKLVSDTATVGPCIYEMASKPINSINDVTPLAPDLTLALFSLNFGPC